VKSQVQSVRSVFHISAYHHLFIFGHGAVGAKLRCRVIRSGRCFRCLSYVRTATQDPATAC
jgi:hypothetical protein